MPRLPFLRPWLLAAATLLLCSAPWAQEAALRKALAERLPKLPAIDEVSRTPVAGLYEVRFGGTNLLYSDEKGEFIFVDGRLIETKTFVDLTEARMQKLLAIDFDKLPLKDALVIRQGKGSRRLAVFADPNCGYCKALERDLLTLKDVTIYTFVVPILGPDSNVKSRDIWCSKDAQRAWRAWMVDGQAPGKAAAACDAAVLDRNLAFAQAHRITGTPALFFEDGTRRPGALNAETMEKLLANAARK